MFIFIFLLPWCSLFVHVNYNFNLDQLCNTYNSMIFIYTMRRESQTTLFFPYSPCVTMHLPKSQRWANFSRSVLCLFCTWPRCASHTTLHHTYFNSCNSDGLSSLRPALMLDDCGVVGCCSNWLASVASMASAAFARTGIRLVTVDGVAGLFATGGVGDEPFDGLCKLDYFVYVCI